MKIIIEINTNNEEQLKKDIEHGYSVLEVIKAFQRECGCDIPFEIVGRRVGDIALSYADASLAKEELNWEAVKDIDNMCRDAWNWQQKNPDGYQ